MFRFSFSLLGLFGLVTIVAMMCGVFVNPSPLWWPFWGSFAIAVFASAMVHHYIGNGSENYRRPRSASARKPGKLRQQH